MIRQRDAVLKRCERCGQKIKDADLHKIVMYIVQQEISEHHYEHVECPENPIYFDGWYPYTPYTFPVTRDLYFHSLLENTFAWNLGCMSGCTFL